MKLVDKVQAEIKAMIINKEYDGDGFLLPEGELAKRFEVSRATVREAVRSLEIYGYLERIHGKGLRVVDNSCQAAVQSISDYMTREELPISEVIEARWVLEDRIAALAAQRICSEEIKRLEECVTIMSQEVSEEVWHKADLQFHVTLAEAAHNRVLYTMVCAYLPMLKHQMHRIGLSIVEPMRFAHQEILDALRAHDSERARQAMVKHMDRIEKEMKASHCMG